jgi:hypothetical protein
MQGLAMWITVLLMVIALYVSYMTLEDTEHPAPAPIVNVHVDQPSEHQIQEWISEAIRQTQSG